MFQLNVQMHQADERGNVYTLLTSFTWCGLTIPAGFESDGASVPRFFWRIVFPPGDPPAMLAAFVHDFIYRTHPKGYDRKEADRAFKILLLDNGVSAVQAHLAYWGVRLGGRAAWKAGGKKTK